MTEDLQRFRRKALRYAERGFRIFPVVPGGKKPYGQLAPNGCHSATTDTQTIKDWWGPARSKPPNLGLATGHVLVVDLDVKSGKDGIKAWQQLQEEKGGAPETTAVQTPSGGVHLFYKVPGSVTVKNSADQLGPGIDIRGEGGYVVVPPSRRDDGAYTFMEGSAPMAEAPPWLLQVIKEPADTTRQREAPADLPESVSEGGRNDYLTRWAGRLRRHGMTEQEMRSVLETVNENRCQPPLPPGEVRQIANSVARYNPADPVKHNNGSKSAESAIVQSGKRSEEPPEWVDFPTDLLPAPVKKYVRAHAKAKHVDEAMIAVPALPVLAGAVGNSREVQIKRSWKERSILWMTLVAMSGDMKSPSLEAAVDPVNRLEMEAKDEHDRRQDQYEYELDQYNQLPPDQKANQAPPEEPEERRRYRVGNVTLEAIVDRHASNPRSLVLVRDELAGWIGSFDRYAQGESDLQDWIEMYEGRLVQSDRVSSGTTDIQNPCVSVVGTTQPGVLERKLTDLHFSSGFAARLMAVRPPSKRRRFTTHDVTRDVYQGYYDLVQRLYEIPMPGDPEPMTLTSSAVHRFGDFVNRNADLQAQLPEGPLRSKLSKVEALAARLALILQLAEDPGATEVNDQAMHRAVLLAEWFRHESARIHHLFGFREASLPEDEQKAQQLPPHFKWQDVAEIWDVKRRQSYNICKRLVRKGLATNNGKHKGYSLTDRALVTSTPSLVAQAAPDFSDLPPKLTTPSAPPNGTPF